MKEEYLLDTCALIALKKNNADGHDQHKAKLSSLDDNDQVCASILSIYELEAGVSHAPNLQLEQETEQVIQSIRNEFEIISVPMDKEATKLFGVLRELYKDWESPSLNKRRLGDKAIIRQNIDLLIATTAIRNKAILVTNDIEPHNTSVYAQYTIQVDNRETVQQRLKDKGIPSAVHYPIPLYRQPAIKQAGVSFPNTETAANIIKY